MIKILYDNQIFKSQNFGGISRYFSELMKGIKNSVDFEFLPKSFYSENKHLRLYDLTHYNWFTEKRRFRGKIRIEKYLTKKEDEKIIKLAEKGNYDIFHPTYYDPSILNHIPDGKPIVATVYDMIHEIYLKDIELPAFKKKLLSKAEKIVAISQNTKNDILRVLPEIPESKIQVIYLSSSLEVLNVRAKKDLPSRYILFVGHRWTYKNFTWFINSIAQFLIKEKLFLVCAGANPFSEPEQSLLIKLNVTNNVRHFHVNNDEDLAALYTYACCFVFPSLYEGFGIPILEAFSCRCPVILSNTSCFPEIAGDAALYFDSDSSESLVKQLSRIVKDRELVETMKDAGTQRNALYNWENTVKQHFELYKSVGAKKPDLSISSSYS